MHAPRTQHAAPDTWQHEPSEQSTAWIVGFAHDSAHSPASELHTAPTVQSALASQSSPIAATSSATHACAPLHESGCSHWSVLRQPVVHAPAPPALPERSILAAQNSSAGHSSSMAHSTPEPLTHSPFAA